MIEVDWVKMHVAKKAYKHEVLIKISQKARFEKNYIVWKDNGSTTYQLNSGSSLRRTI